MRVAKIKQTNGRHGLDIRDLDDREMRHLTAFLVALERRSPMSNESATYAIRPRELPETD